MKIKDKNEILKKKIDSIHCNYNFFVIVRKLKNISFETNH